MQILSQIFQRSSSANLPPSHVSRLNVVPRPNVTATGAEEMSCRSKRRCFGNGVDKATISIVFSCCVCNPWNHRDPFGLFSAWLLSFHFTAGGLVVHASTSPTKRLALNTDIGGDAHRRTCIFLFPNGMRLSLEPHLLQTRAIVVISTCSSPSTLRFWPHFLFQTPRLRWSLLVLLGNGTLGRRVAPQSSQYAYP